MTSFKVNKTLGLLRMLTRSAVNTIYEAFVRPHLDYGDILYNQAYNMTLHRKLEFVQYNFCLTITGAIQKLYQELSVELLQ